MDLIGKVYAQAADSVAKSTIPFTAPGAGSPTPFITSGVSTTPVPEAMIYLDAPVNTLMVDQKVTIKVRINTAGKMIKSFKFVVKYDPAFFQITDADSTKANVQITFNDTFFVQDTNGVETSSGRITVEASSDQGTTTVSGRAVAEFELTSKQEGFSQVGVQINDSSLLDTNNLDVLKSTGNPIDFVISNAQITTTVSPSGPAPTPTGTLPRNGIFDEFGAANALITGIIMISVGAYLYKMQKNAKKKL